MARIFVSYKRKNSDLVQPLVKHIEDSIGEECWMDLTGIESGQQFKSVICRAINEASVVLFMYSALHLEIEDPENDWTIKELNFASKKKKRIVVIQIDGSDLDDVFLFDYGAMNNIDATDPVQVEKLINDLKNWLSIPTKPATKTAAKPKSTGTSQAKAKSVSTNTSTSTSTTTRAKPKSVSKTTNTSTTETDAVKPSRSKTTTKTTTTSSSTPRWWGYSVVLKTMGYVPGAVQVYLKTLSHGVSFPKKLEASKLPFTIAKNISREQAETIKTRLKLLGADAYIA